MSKVFVFGASSSKQSINKQLANYAANLIPEVDLNAVDLNDFEMPIYSIDKEKATGIPDLAKQFKAHINSSDGIIVSFAEHNGSYTTAFKNILDWISRLEKPVWGNKPMLVLSTSQGARGAASVHQAAVLGCGYMGGEVVGQMSLPSFDQNFDSTAGIVDAELKAELAGQVAKFIAALALV